MTEPATQTLQAVAREIGVALGEARVALEAHVEQPGNPALLERCRHELQQVQGVLRVLEIYGAALLAEEMEHVARYLIGLGGERKNQAEALEALMRAMVQLPAYLERVLAGGRDLALVLLPLLNDLRAVRGSALLSEGTLLLLNLKSDRQAQPTAPAPGEDPVSVAQWGRRLRTRFQTGLVGWIRGERTEQNLEMLATVATRLEQAATTQPVFQLWWVIGALIEALRENGIEGGISVKRLLGLADREIRRLYEQGEERYAQHQPVELLNNLLYYIARADCSGPRIAAVRNSFRLSELLPVDESVEQERENLSAPSIKLMHTVAAAIREDLSKVKDVLDIYVRRGAGQTEELAPQVSMLRKIGDTLGVLGLGELRARVQEATGKLEAIIAGTEPGGEPALELVAASLIKVEDHLDDQLVGLILPRKAAPGETDSPDHDFQQVQAAVLRECIVNLARIKEYVTQNVAGILDSTGFDNWPQLMHGINAGLLLLGKPRAVEVVEGISVHLKRVMQPGGTAFAPEYLDRLADAIVSLEYYIETLQAGRSDPWYMLDNARACLDQLARGPERILPTVPLLDATGHTRTLRIEPPQPTDDNGAQLLERAAAELPVLAAAPSPQPTLTLPDPELVQLFIDEAKEEVAKIQQQFPIWDHNPLEGEALLIVRRSFHTLKGSGRMVNARQLSEFAWAIENLLNRILEGTSQRSPAALETLRAAVSLLPQLVSELETGRPGRTDTALLTARAHALANGREDLATRAPPPAASAGVAAAMPARPEVSADAAAQAHAPDLVDPAAGARPGDTSTPVPLAEEGPEPDPALREIYKREIAGHVTNVRAWIARELRLSVPHILTEEVYRACHTLMGASTMAEARHGIRLAEPINHWLRKSFDSGAGLDDSDLMLLAECMAAMEGVAGHLDEGTGFFVVHDTLRARIARADVELDRRIAESSEIAPPSVEMPAPTTLPEPQPVMAAPPSAAESAVSGPAAPIPESAAAAPAVAPETPPADYDPEIVAIFSEEAVELIDAAESALAAWNLAPHDGEQVAALRRSLHTLKGGARMAGIVPMGELAHELESLVTRIEGGLSSGDERARTVAQEALDELARMREAIAAGRQALSAPGLIARIHSASSGALPDHASTDVQPAMVFQSPQPESPPTDIADLQMRDGDGAAPSAEPPVAQMAPSISVEPPALAAAGMPETQVPETQVPETQVPEAIAPESTLEAIPLEVALPEAIAPEFRPEETTLEAAVPDAITSAAMPATIGAEFTPEAIASEAIASESVPERPEPEFASESITLEFSREAITPEAITPEPITAEAITPGPMPEASRAEFTPEAIKPALTPDALTAEAKSPPAPLPSAPLPPAPLPPGREPVAAADRVEMARVSAELLDQLLNSAGEVSISRARLEQQLGSIEFNLGELSRTVTRLKEQLRKLEIETEAQILHRHENEQGHRLEFDPLELDRYSSIQQFSRALAESANDVASIQGLLETLITEAQNLLQQQSRTVTELQNGLMRTRMVSLQRHIQRLARIVRQAAADTGKRAELTVDGASGELDRQVLERMLPPLEHLLRNAVVHGIELPERRHAAGKDETGQIRLILKREGAEVIIEVSDDGAGMNLAAIRAKGRALGLIQAEQELSDEDVMQLVLEPGFSTASSLTQQAGRGVGMDVVAVEIKKLGGALHMESTPDRGTRFVIRLPFTLAISHALVVRTGDEYYALPLPTVEGVVRLPRDDVAAHLRADGPSYNHGGLKYRLQPLAVYVGMEPSALPEQDVTIPIVLVRAGEHSTGLVADELIGSREIVVKPVGAQISAIRGISGATVLGDGRIVVILDITSLVRAEWRGRAPPTVVREKADHRTTVLVVDDSITVRRVTQRLLERSGMRVLTARDGMDAVALLAEHVPDVILLDIEMPRMDGYELAAHVRNDPRLSDVPIIMITSRVGEKHRARAIELGVDDYLGKPYQESQLLDAIAPLVARRRAGPRALGSAR